MNGAVDVPVIGNCSMALDSTLILFWRTVVKEKWLNFLFTADRIE